MIWTLVAVGLLYVCATAPFVVYIWWVTSATPEHVQRSLDTSRRRSAMSTEYIQIAKDLAKKIDSGEPIDTNQQFDFGDDFGRVLDRALRDLGWSVTPDQPRSLNASFESRVGRAGRRVHITSACFMGSFTRVEIYN